MQHTCIRPHCGNRYEDKDIEPYYCPSCNEQRKEAAKVIDAKIAARPKRKVLRESDGLVPIINTPSRVFFRM